MPKISKALILILPIIATALCFGIASVFASTPPLSERVLGNADAPVTVIEYASLTCDHCKRFHLEVLPRLKEAYIDTGKVKLIYRHFPLDQVAMMAASLSECAPRIRFFGLVEVLFKTEDRWAHSPDPKAGLAQIGRLAGISQPAFEACLADDKLSTAIAEELRTGQQKHNVNSTPTFIVGDKVLRGVRSYEEMAKALDSAGPR